MGRRPTFRFQRSTFNTFKTQLRALENPVVRQINALALIRIRKKRTNTLVISLDFKNRKINGWEFVGTIQRFVLEDEIYSAVRCTLGHTIPEPYSTNTLKVCDNCHRPHTKETIFILYDVTTQQYRKVGYECLKEFVVTTNCSNHIDTLLYNLEVIDLVNRWTDQKQKPKFIFTVGNVLAWTHSVVEKYGWLSIKDAVDKMPTANLVKFSMVDHTRGINVYQVEKSNENMNMAFKLMRTVRKITEKRLKVGVAFDYIKLLYKLKYVTPAYLDALIESYPIVLKELKKGKL